MKNYLRNNWTTLWNRLEFPIHSEENVFKDLLNRYQAKERHYHNLIHIYRMLVDSERMSCGPEVQLAIWFHDVIYSIIRSDNEKKSVEYFSYRMSQSGIQNERLLCEVSRLILLTHTHRTTGDDIRGQQLIDLDLSILSASPDVYTEYMRNIRREYRLYPNWIYQSGRSKALQSFLNMKSIYHTDTFKAYESNARSNLTSELQLMKDKDWAY